MGLKITRTSTVQPNPFSRETRIAFSTAVDVFTHIKIYDASGRLVRELLGDRLDAGSHEVIWNGRNQSGLKLPAGVYFVEIDMGNQFDVKKAVLLE